MLLEVTGLDAFYGQNQALYGVAFSLDDGHIRTLLGANGAGKTTILRAICGMVRVAGDISFDGEIPKNYDRYLGPILFSPYADDLADRLPAGLEDVLELACGTGILTRRLLNRLQAAARLISTDLSPQMLEYAEGRVGLSDRVQ